MRLWYLSRLALERRLEPHRDYQQSGVYDRRPSAIMLFARVISGCLAFMAFVLGLSATSTHRTHRENYQTPKFSSSVDPRAISQSAASFVPFTSNYSSSLRAGVFIKALDGTEIVIQRPDSQSRGTILLLHGCSHSATDYFPSGQDCPHCLGLPEPSRIAQMSLWRGLNVVAVSSTNRDRKCWHTNPETGEGEDYDRVRTALHEANRRNAYFPNLPLYAVGGSSGGFFASSLPLHFPIAGVYSVISTSISVLWVDKDKSKRSFPPHAFTHMGTRDRRTASRVKEAMRILKTLEVATVDFNVEPRPVTEQYLRDAVPLWNVSTISEVVAALRRTGYINGSYFLVSDPRKSRWREAVEHLKEKLGDSLIADQSALSEELNRAWASHETTSDFFMEALDFLESEVNRPGP